MTVELIETNLICDYCVKNDPHGVCHERYQNASSCPNGWFMGKELIEVHDERG